MPSIVYVLFFTLFLSFNQMGAIQNPKDGIFGQECNQTCGDFQVSFPFYMSSNASCGWSRPHESFHLSCLNSTSLFLNLNSQSFRVLEFFSDGVLVGFPGFSNTCRPYNDLKSFGFGGNNWFGISGDNVIGLYDCEDSFLCKANCEANDLPGCDRSGTANGPSCCYPLSDQSVWHFGNGFDVFSKYECRGFSSWVVPRGMTSGKRGVKLEWALPINSSKDACHFNAHSLNSSSVRHGMRCVCDDGFVGDGYVNGTGCLKSCFKDGKEKFDEDCDPKREGKREMLIVTGVLLSSFVVVSLVSLVCMIKRSVKSAGYGSKQKPQFRSTLSLRKSCNTRLFTFHELDEATKGFNEAQKLVMDCTTNGGVFYGTLKDASSIAVQRVPCENEQDLIQVLTHIELLSSILHRHLARILGCCIDSGYTPIVVYEFPENGSLKDHLHQSKGEMTGLDWYKRLSIAAQTASLLAFLQHEISPPVFHRHLNTSCIFLDQDYNVKLACFGLLGNSNSYRSDVYDMGVILLEIISGSNHTDLPTLALQKIRDGKLEEMLDPLLYYHEQPPFRKEQIEMVSDIATRCLIFGGSGKLGMLDVARELVHIMKESIDGDSKRAPALEETFSNSSLLQMISVSPDSIYVP